MRSWTYEPPVDLDQPLGERLRRFPREPDMLQYGVRATSALAIRAWLKTYHRFQIHGLENLPSNGSFVMVANHSSHLDALCLLSAIPMNRLHRAFPAAAADYFFESIPRVALSVLVVNALPFHREAHIRQSLIVCQELLANPGNILIIFPEGTRSADGKVGAFRPGIGMLLAGSDVPVVPCYLSGAHEALPKGAWFPRPRAVRLEIGKPRNFSQYYHQKESIRLLCDELREAVIATQPGNKGRTDGQFLPTGDGSHPVSGAKPRIEPLR
jgi:1-acyl-sn-glycerol-3-phosphate acyltransferase